MIVYTVLALGLPSLLYYIYSYLKKTRSLFFSLPSLKRSFWFGNILEMEKYVKNDRHPDYGLVQIHEDLGQPDVFLLDIAPIFRMLIICSPTIAEQISKPSSRYPYSLPKSWTFKDVIPLVGKQSILINEGENWKTKRKQFQPGFQPNHLKTVLPLVIGEARILVSNLMEKAESDEPFKLGQVLQNMTLDVITCVVLGYSIHAQTTPEGQGICGPRGVLTAFRKVQQNFVLRGAVSWEGINPLRMWRLQKYERILGQEMRKLITEATRDPDPSSRAVVHLALKDRPLTPEVLQESADQLRTFIFAGFDTTSTTLQWAFYYLSLPENASVLEALCAEHDQLLGPVENQDSIEAFLLTDPTMPYTTAVIKESLRMEPPAATARWVPPTDEPCYITRQDGTQHCINGTPVYINHRIILQSPQFWGPDAKTFRPARWLDRAYVAALPVGAFRPFERGPRACIGQELAMMEAKVVLALTVRRFVFEKWTPVEERSDLGDVWNVNSITATPNDMMRMIIKRRC